MRSQVLIKIFLLGNIVVLLITSGNYGRKKKLCNEVTSYFSRENLTDTDLRKKISPDAIYSIVNDDTANTTAKVKRFFTEAAKYTDYSFKKNASFVYVVFDADNELVSGPSISIKSVEGNWYITDVRFGK